MPQTTQAEMYRRRATLGAKAINSAEGLVKRIERKSAELTPELRARLRALGEG